MHSKNEKKKNHEVHEVLAQQFQYAEKHTKKLQKQFQTAKHSAEFN